MRNKTIKAASHNSPPNEPGLDTQVWFTGRRPAFSMDTPCLIREFVLRPFHRCDVVMLQSRSQRVAAEAAVRNRLNDFLRNHLSKPDGSKIDESELIPSNVEARYKTAHARGYIRFGQEEERKGKKPLLVRSEIMIDVHTEYVAIEIRVFPFATVEESSAAQASLKKLQKTQDVLNEVKNYQSEAELAQLSESEALVQADQNKQSLYDGFWAYTDFNVEGTRLFFALGCKSTLTCAVLGPACASCSKLSKERNGAEAQLQIKAVFSGVVLQLGNGAHDADNRSSLNQQIVPEWHGHSEVYSTTANVSLDEHFNAHMKENVQCLQRNAHLFKKILGFWPSNNIDDPDNDAHAGGAVLCGVLDGLGIYGCSYSPAHIAEPETASWSEVGFFLLYSGPSRNQLGRFVQRLLSCGQNRVFLQPDFVTFKHATLKLRAMSDQLDRESLEYAFKQSDIENIRQKMKKASDSVRGGIQFRVRRTRGYWNNLQGLISSIRSVRIIGWQTYDDYIIRTYGSHVLTYEEAGSLLEELETKISRAEEALESQAAIDLARSAARLAVLGGIGLLATLSIEVIEPYPELIEQVCDGSSVSVCGSAKELNQPSLLNAFEFGVPAFAMSCFAILAVYWLVSFGLSLLKRWKSRTRINASKRRWKES